MKNFDLTVGQLLEFIQKNNIPLDAKVKYERIEDSYFEEHGWDKSSTMKPHELYNEMGDCEFITTFTCIKYPDDPDLYLTAHY